MNTDQFTSQIQLETKADTLAKLKILFDSQLEIFNTNRFKTTDEKTNRLNALSKLGEVILQAP